MIYHLNLERMEGRWLAAVAELPGCFTSDPDQKAVLGGISEAIRSHLDWERAHGETLPDYDVSVITSELHIGWLSAPDYEVNAFFASDRPPLEASEVELALRLLAWSRADLLAAIEGISESHLTQDVEDGWSIRRILQHVATAESWYLQNLDLATPNGTEDIMLDEVRTNLVDALPALAGDNRLTSVHQGIWSPRKLVRRALWHERDHTPHILQFRRRLGLSPDSI